MLNICFYFQVHQPYRLRTYPFFSIGTNHDYFDHIKNRTVFLKVAEKCYLPTNYLLLKLLNQHPEFKITYSFFGIFLDQCIEYCSEVLHSFQALVETGRVEILAETYYHSLAFLYSKQEFYKQVQLHDQRIQQLFGIKPTVFRNTELIYNNELAHTVHSMGYKGILLEGADKVLGWRSPNFVYKALNVPIKLLLKNYKLSDDIAFRFSDKGWQEHPLSTEKYAQWLNSIHGNGTNVNLFMDYETFGEHQWEDCGIFDFLRYLPGELLKHPNNRFSFPSEIIDQYQANNELDIPYFLSWADTERDLSAWLGNDMQQSALEKLYSLETKILETDDKDLIDDWRKLQTSDHFYYMCTKWFNDGDVHKYFNPFDSPYDAFISFMNAFQDLQQRLNHHIQVENHRTQPNL